MGVESGWRRSSQLMLQWDGQRRGENVCQMKVLHRNEWSCVQLRDS